MAKETDMGTETVAIVKVWEEFASLFNDTFSSTPVVLTLSSSEVKKKSGAINIDTAGCELSSEVLDLWWMAREEGYDAGPPESDAGIHYATDDKVFEAETFGDTFTEAPIVISSSGGPTAGGKKHSVKSVTTTGFDICSEEIGNVYWIAKIAGFYDGS